jgi:alkanesulfonate monooxygenase SsuD/methylene tetrahydromethanopterin reductase-like flavin-dependent oxidoreductase (luciferase family)
VPLAESRARFDECYEIMHKAWTEEVFSYDGQFNSYRDIAIWPRPVQQPAPPVWVPVSGSKDSIEWAAAHNIPITPGNNPGAARQDTIGYYSQELARHGHEITPSHLNIAVDAYVADSKQQAIDEYAPYRHYFHTLFNYNHLAAAQAGGYYQEGSTAHLRKELQDKARDDSHRLRERTMEEVVAEGQAGNWGTPKEIADSIIAEAEDAGAETVLVSLNRGGLPQDMFLNQIRRFGTEVLPILQKHRITKVPHAA